MAEAVELKKNLYEANSENWEELVINSEVPVVVDFWAEWCAPCKMMAPVFEETAAEYEGKAKFVKLETDSNREISMRYGIMSIPTIGFFNNGEPIDGLTGAVPKEALKSKLDEVLAKVQ